MKIDLQAPIRRVVPCFFSLCNGAELTEDEEGVELADHAAARRNAVERLGGVMADGPASRASATLVPAMCWMTVEGCYAKTANSRESRGPATAAHSRGATKRDEIAAGDAAVDRMIRRNIEQYGA